MVCTLPAPALRTIILSSPMRACNTEGCLLVRDRGKIAQGLEVGGGWFYGRSAALSHIAGSMGSCLVNTEKCLIIRVKPRYFQYLLSRPISIYKLQHRAGLFPSFLQDSLLGCFSTLIGCLICLHLFFNWLSISGKVLWGNRRFPCLVLLNVLDEFASHFSEGFRAFE